MEDRHAAAVALGALLLAVGLGRGLAPASVEPLPRPAELAGAEGLLWGRPLDLHRADPATLQVLPGIGPSRAAAIARARCRRPFAAVSDLERIPGIGPRTVAGLTGWAEVRDPSPGGCAQDPAARPREVPREMDGGGAP